VWDDEELRPKVGDPVLMRPAKAGEIAERFDEYLVVDLKNNNIVKRVKTYRGMGLTFY
jgi:D-serine deaminase-like pyridoxal phosphate-dependent protein